MICKAARLLKGETLDEQLLECYKLYDRPVWKYPRLKTNVVECNEHWQIDVAYMRHVNGYNKQLQYWLVVVNLFSQYALVKPAKNPQSQNITNKFKEILLKDGVPKKVQSDQGVEFQHIHEVLTRKYGFHMFHTYNREIKSAIAELLICKLKQMMQCVTTVTGQFNYVKYMNIIVDCSNKSLHLSLGSNMTLHDIYRKGVKKQFGHFSNVTKQFLKKVKESAFHV